MPVSPHNGGRQFPTMFHGSAEPIPVGQVVQPGQVVGRQSHSTSSRPFAYATTRRDWATRFAQTGADRTETAPHVYEVEPVGSFEPDPGFPRTKGTGEEHAYRSQQGFRVVREIDPWVGPSTRSIASQQTLRYKARLGEMGWSLGGDGALRRIQEPPRLRGAR